MTTDRGSTWRVALRVACWLSCFAAVPAAAQDVAGASLATRKQLQDQLARLETTRGQGPELAILRRRLESGDFQAGDRIFLRVAGEQALTDTFTVGAGPVLGLPQIGALSLAGVLRSELSACVAAYLAHYIRDPVVQVRPLIRILVAGDVARPGYYALPPELPLADVITAAGGLTQRANTNDIRLERGDNQIWTGPRLQEALGRGYSLDQLNLQAGDRLVVPEKGGVNTMQLIGLALAIPAAIYTMSMIHW
jgi:protein involved in polysaccharide export with SLBB domain